MAKKETLVRILESLQAKRARRLTVRVVLLLLVLSGTGIAADPEQVSRLKRSLGDWNAWASVNPDAIDLGGAELREANLSRANLVNADLGGANLSGADLREADLREANLSRANLVNADLGGANLSGADLREADLREADLRRAIWAPQQLPRAQVLAKAFGLAELRGPTHLLTSMYQDLKDDGFASAAREINVAVRRSSPTALDWFLFDLTCVYGTDPLRPIVLLMGLTFVLIPIYLVAVWAAAESVLSRVRTAARMSVLGNLNFIALFLTSLPPPFNQLNEQVPHTWTSRVQGAASLFLLALSWASAIGQPFELGGLTDTTSSTFRAVAVLGGASIALWGVAFGRSTTVATIADRKRAAVADVRVAGDIHIDPVAVDQKEGAGGPSADVKQSAGGDAESPYPRDKVSAWEQRLRAACEDSERIAEDARRRGHFPMGWRLDWTGWCRFLLRCHGGARSCRNQHGTARNRSSSPRIQLFPSTARNARLH